MSDYFRTSNRELKRHEAVLRSSVFAIFGEAVAGTSVIKAYGVQDLYRERLDKTIDNMNSAYYLTFSSQCWLSLRLDMTGILLALITCLLVVTNVIRINPATAGVLLTYVLQVIGQIQFAIRQVCWTRHYNAPVLIVYTACGSRERHEFHGAHTVLRKRAAF